jgi:FkbM family methyltransferase
LWLWDSATFHFGKRKIVSLPGGWGMVCHPRAYRVFSRDQVSDPEQSLEFRSFLSRCREGMLLFDIGAHFGVFSLAAAHFGGKAIAADPSPIATRMIAVQAGLNHCGDKIQILQATVSENSGVVGMLSSGVFSNGYFQAAPGRMDVRETRAVTIDEMTLQFGRPTHIKIDVEGHEGEVIRGGKRTLQDFSPLVFLELHNELILSNGGDPDSVIGELTELGYVLLGLDDARRTARGTEPIVRLVAERQARA